MIYHCQLCLDRVTDLGAPLLILYHELCNHYIKNGPYPLDPYFEPYLVNMVRKLEKDGHLLSRDIDKNIILVKPLGHDVWEHGINVSHYFCRNRRRHPLRE